MFNFGLSDTQQALKTSIRQYLDRECDSLQIRKVLEDSNRFSAKKWRDIADLGLLGVGIQEEFGGSGLGCTDTVVVMESLGRAVFPAPYLESATVADLIGKAGSDEQKSKYLPGIGAGELVATFAVDEPGGYWDAAAVQATATLAGDKYRLQGTKLWVPYANVADLIVCAVRTSGSGDSEKGISLIALEPKQLGMSIKILDGMDAAYQLCEVHLDGLLVPAAQIISAVDHGWPVWVEARRLATLLASAEMVGGMEKCLEMIVAYSKDRVQFGKPIGSYQAVKHRCADMLIDLEAVRGSVYYAAWALQNREPGVDLAISSAKAYASDAYVKTAENSLQSFGAIGFTWEHDIHFYLKRARRLAMSFGDATFHRECIAECWI